MSIIKETERDSVILISLVGLFGGVSSVAFLMTGLDIAAIILTCLLAIWTGIRTPRATVKQIYKGWIIGGLLSFGIVILSLVIPDSIPLVIFAPVGVGRLLAVDAFWTIVAIPAIGIICALRGRQFCDERGFKLGFRLFAFVILASVSPIASILVIGIIR